jgi:tetratricopeptide (TPR) repeat protein
MSFVADDLAAWLIGVLADAGRKKLLALALGTEQERALRQAATAAVWRVAGEVRPQGGAQAEELAIVVSEIFSDPVPDALTRVQATMLEALRAGIAGQLAVLDDASMTGTGQSSAEILELSPVMLAERLTGHLVREIVVRGARGGPLEPLAAQLNHDVTHLQGRRLEGMVGQLAGEIREVLAWEHPSQAGRPLQVSSLGVRHSLPPDVAVLTGREAELDRMVAPVTADAGRDGAGMIYAIAGMPGVGKTVLAVHAAHLLRHRFPDRQLFIDLHAHTPGQDPVSPETALAWLLTATGVDARSLPDDLDGRASLWRDRMTGQRALLVLDNAASSGQVASLLPGGERCMVVITSRRYLADLPGSVIPLLVGTLPVDKAREMFARLAPRVAADPAAQVAELAKMAGYLPLAISLLARVYARHPTWALADLIRETRASMLTLAAEKNTVAAAFDVSYRYLDSSLQEFFCSLGTHPGTTIDTYAATALADIGLNQAVRYLDALHREGLLTEASYRRYTMHDLIRRYSQDLAAASPVTAREQALERLLYYYQHTAALVETSLRRQTRTTPASRSVVPPAVIPDLSDSTEALAWIRAERANLLACLDHVTEMSQHARVTILTDAIAALFRYDGPWSEAITRHRAAVAAARSVGDRLGEADALGNLGTICRLTGDYPGAASAQEEALSIYRDLDDRLGQANALNELGMVRQLTGHYPGAARAQGEALGIYRDLDDRLGQASALIERGIVWKLTADYPSATLALEEAQGISRDIGDRLYQASALTQLGMVRMLTSDYPRAIRELEEALGIYHERGNPLGKANVLNRLGTVRLLTGDNPGASLAVAEALDIYHDLGSRLGRAEALSNLGVIRRLTGDYPAATLALEESLSIFRDISARLGQAGALLALGVVRRLTGDCPGAARAMEEALSIYRDLGHRDGEVAVLNEIGTLYRVRDDLSQAGVYHRQALGLAREIGSYWNEAHALAALGRCALSVGNVADAKSSLRQALDIFQRIGAADTLSVSAELYALTDH